MPARSTRPPARRRHHFGPLNLTVATLTLITAVARADSLTSWEGDRPIPTPQEAARAASALRPPHRAAPARVMGEPGADGTWSLIGPPSGVQRIEPSVVFDPVRQRLVSFGGTDGNLTATHVFPLAQGSWSLLTTAGIPPAGRRLHGAVYDSSHDRMIVFGGYDGDSLFGDVWSLAFTGGTPTWSELSVPAGPTARAGFVAAYDAANDRMLVFGGYDGVSDSTGLAHDVWALSLGASPAWTQVLPAGTPPAGRVGMVGGFDPTNSVFYVFGGTGLDDSSELWKLTLGGSPAWSLVSASNDPGARALAAGGFDAVSGRFVIFGGLSVQYDGVFWVSTTLADVWEIDPAAASPAWSNVTPDPSITPRWGPGGTISPAGDLYVMAGVTDRGQALSDVWKLNVANPVAWTTWQDLFPPRLQEVMVMDSQRHRLVAFGGTDGALRNDTYVHSLDFGRGWAPLATAGTPPPPRRLHTGIYDPVGDRMLIFGGSGNASLLNDTWQLSFATPTPTWSQLAPAGPLPTPRAGQVTAYDPVGHRMIISLGWDGVSSPAYRIGDTWALSLDDPITWSQLDTGPGPTPRSSASAVYDDATQSMVVFGGTDPAFQNETWSLSLGSPAWTLISTSSTPPAREEQSAVYDGSRDRMVIFGGYDTPTPYSHNYDDLWSLSFRDPAAWAQLAPGGTAPSPRWGMKAVLDPQADGMWMYGGWDYTYSQELWFLQWSQPTAPATILSTQADAFADHVTLGWQLPGATHASATIQRSTDGVTWKRVGMRFPNGLSLPFTDRGVSPGLHCAWRSVVAAPGNTMASAPVWLTIPAAAPPSRPIAFGLRLGAARRPGSIAVTCALPTAGPARVQLLDVAGRVRDARDLSGMKGELPIELGRNLESGVFFARLEGMGRVARLKTVVLR